MATSASIPCFFPNCLAHQLDVTSTLGCISHASSFQCHTQVVAAGGVKALLELLSHANNCASSTNYSNSTSTSSTSSATSTSSRGVAERTSTKALCLLCQLLGVTEGQQALINLGGLPVLAEWAAAEPGPVLQALTGFCTSGSKAHQLAVAQVRPQR